MGEMITINDIQMRISEAIRYSGMKKKDIAKALNLNLNMIYLYIKGARTPSLETLENLCKLLDEDANYILCQE